MSALNRGGSVMFLFECAVTFEAEAATVWRIWTDVARWPEWDVSKEIAQMDGEFQPGTSGWVKKHNALGGTFAITSVEPGLALDQREPAAAGPGDLRPRRRASARRPGPGGQERAGGRRLRRAVPGAGRAADAPGHRDLTGRAATTGPGRAGPGQTGSGGASAGGAAAGRRSAGRLAGRRSAGLASRPALSRPAQQAPAGAHRSRLGPSPSGRPGGPAAHPMLLNAPVVNNAPYAGSMPSGVTGRPPWTTR